MAERPGVQIEIGADFSALINGFAQATQSLTDGTARLQGAFGGLANVVERAAGPLKALMAIAAGGALFKSAVDETVSWTEQVKRLSQILGITTESASGLAKALDKLGIDGDMYLGAARRMEMALRTQEKLLNANGVATKTANGEQLTTQQVMLNTIARLKQLEEGHERNQLAMVAFSRNAQSLTPLLKLNAAALAEGAAEAAALNMVVRADGVNAVQAYREAMRQMGDGLQAAKYQIGAELIPELTKLANLLANNAKLISGTIVGAFVMLREVLGLTVVKVAAFGYVVKTLTGDSLAILGKGLWDLGMKVKESAAMFMHLGIPAVRSFGLALKSALGPIGIVIIAITALVTAFDVLRTRAREAEEQTKAQTEAMLKQRQQFADATEEIRAYDEALKDNTLSEEQKKILEDRRALAIQRLNDIYPGFNANLRDEAGNQRSIADAIRVTNAQIAANIQAKIQQAEVEIETLQMQRFERERLGGAGAAEAAMLADFDAKIADGRRRLAMMKEQYGEARRLAVQRYDEPPKKEGDKFKRETVEDERKKELDRLQLAARFADEHYRLRLKRDADILAAEKALEKDASGALAEQKKVIEANYQEDVRRLNESHSARRRKALLDEAQLVAGARKKIEIETARSLEDIDLKIAQARRAKNPTEARTLQRERAAIEAAGRERLAQYDRDFEQQRQRTALDSALVTAKGKERIFLETARSLLDVEAKIAAARTRGDDKEVARLERERDTISATGEEREAAVDREHATRMRALYAEIDQARAVTEAQKDQIETSRQLVELDAQLLEANAEAESTGDRSRVAELELEKRKVQELAAARERARQADKARAAGQYETEYMEQKLEEQYSIVDHFARLGAASEAEVIMARQEADEQRYANRVRLLQEEFAASQTSADRQLEIARTLVIEEEKQKNQRVATQRALVAQALAPWRDMFSSITSSWSNVLANVITGSMKAKDAFKAMATAVKQAFAQMISELLMNWLRRLIFQAMAAAGEATRNVGVAVTGAAASQAAIPVVGPAMAHAAAGEMLAFLAPFKAMAMVPAAAGGWDIPAGATGLMRYHEREMVLPAKYAQIIRDMADSEDRTGAPGGSAQPVTINIQAWDGADVKRVLRDYRGDLMRVVREAVKEGR